MTMLESAGAEVEDPAGEVLRGNLDRGDVPGLVLPEEVVTSLAGQLAERARSGEPVTLTGPGGLLTGVIGQVLQAGLAAELGAHLDGPGGDGGENRRNGTSAKTLNTEVGPVRLAVPRDRGGSFDPVLVPKQATRSDGLNAVIISLYAKGMSVRDIARHVRQTAGVDLSADTISRVTDGALEGMREWQHRPLEPFYPVVYIDALVAKVRDGAAVRNKAVNIAVGIDDGGAKRVLGIWVAAAEGAKAWAQALAQLRNRGLEETLFVCCDGLTGLGEEITATWPETTVQTCVVHLIRRSLNYASYGDRKAIAAGPAGRLYRVRRGRGLCRPGRFLRHAAREEVPGRGCGLGKGMGPVHPVPGIWAGYAEGALHDKCHRELQPGNAESPENAHPVPER